eukprot:2787229-Amphidinium_carterae.2
MTVAYARRLDESILATPALLAISSRHVSSGLPTTAHSGEVCVPYLDPSGFRFIFKLLSLIRVSVLWLILLTVGLASQKPRPQGLGFQTRRKWPHQCFVAGCCSAHGSSY